MRTWSSAALLCLLALLLPCARQILAQTEHFGGAVNTLGSGFKLPYGVAVDSLGNVFVADTDNNAVKEIVAEGGVVSETSTVKTVGSGFKGPEGVVVDKKGDVFVGDTYNSAVKEIIAVHGVVSSASTVITVGSGFKYPGGVAVDGRGNVFVADTYNHAVKEIIAVDGVVSSTSTVKTVGSGFIYPGGVALDRNGNVFVACSGNGAVYEIMAVDGIVSSTSTVNTVGSGFIRPEGVALDSSGNVFVSDWVNGTVKEIVAGTGGAAKGTVSSASTVMVVGSGFNKPEGLAVDGSGNVLVADRDDSVVTKIVAGQKTSVPVRIAPIPNVTVQGTPAVGQVQLEPHDGKTKFYLGDRIPLDLVFRRTSGDKPLYVNATLYGDLVDQVEITPAKGWIQWHGQSGHDYAVMGPPITTGELRVPVLLNEGFVFRQAGHYEIRVTTRRLGGTKPEVTNTVGIDLEEMPEEMESAEVRELVAEIASTANTKESHTARVAAVAKLAALGGDDALRVKMRMMLAADGDMRQNSRLALASTRNLDLQLSLLEAAWNDVSTAPFYDLADALEQTRLLMRGEMMQGWTMIAGVNDNETTRRAAREHSADIDTMIRSLPQRSGESRSFAVYLLFEDHSLSPAQLATVKLVVLEDFASMPTLEQRMLLETRWPELKDTLLEPALKVMLNETRPGLMGDPNDAIKRLVELDPQAARPYVIRYACDATISLQLKSVAALPDATLTEVDDCLSAILAQPWTRATQNSWKWKAELAARFATEKVVPSVRKGWTDKSQDGVVLAILLRYEPAEAVAYLKAHDTLDLNSFFEINNIFKARRTSYPQELRAWLRDEVQNAPDQTAGSAAYDLSQCGLAEDRDVIEARLKKMWAGWAADPTTDVKVIQERTSAEANLMSSLRGSVRTWYMTNVEAAELARGCISDQCRNYGKPRTPDAPFVDPE
jgi:sugar lactone lactonase YvrE